MARPVKAKRSKLPKRAAKTIAANSSSAATRRALPRVPLELPLITTETDTRDVLAHAGEDARELQDYFIVDVDAHVKEIAFWSEITNLIDSDVYRQMAKSFSARGRSVAGLMNMQPGMAHQDVFGRIPHDRGNDEPTGDNTQHRQVELTRRAMDSMGIDYMVVFPTPMLQLGMHPQPEVEVELGKAFNYWLIDRILPQDKRMLGLPYLPFCDPEACIKIVEHYTDKPGVVGFTVTTARHKAVHHNSFMRLYAAIQASGKPLAFHAGYHWGDPSMMQINRFIGMHALSFVHFSMVHMTNWVLNGIPERFPKLKVIWIESGLSWVPHLMQRLDNEYMMRSSEAPLLRRKPSEYMREMFYTSQPLETSNMKLTEAHFDAVKAETQLLFSSDWPHWDFDTPSSISRLPFLTDTQRRNILGLSAAKLFGLKVPKKKLATIARPPSWGG
ncbi:MAG: amidohydrolase family protein [Burkholderiales bacterium]